jgi:NAD+ synthase
MEKKILLPKMNPVIVSKEIEDFIIEQVLNCDFSGCVIGLSGGVDSTTTAALTKSAFDRYNKSTSDGKKLELVGYMLPSKISSSYDTKDGESVAKRLNIRYEILNIESVVGAYKFTNPEALENKYDRGNLISRVRANVLSTKAASERKLVVGTGNKDEDFGIGYYTLFGDGAVHLSPIGNLSKRLVREMAEYYGFKDIAYREPAAGLEPGQTDFKDLGYHYGLVELVSLGIEQGFEKYELAKENQIVSLAEKDIQQYENSFGNKKFHSVDEMVKDILRRNKIADVKSAILHPPTPKITFYYG